MITAMVTDAAGPARRRVLVGTGALVGLALWACALVLSPLGTGPARAADGERVRSMAVTLALRPDASLHVTEQIEYDFAGSSGKHGFERFLPLARRFDDERNRVYPLSNATASSPSGAPADLDVSGGDTTTLRVGDKNRTVSGVQTYLLQYDLAGVVDDAEGGQQLYWNAIGGQWQVPIDQALVTVTGPAAVQRATCYQGGTGATARCQAAAPSGPTVTFAATGALQPGEGLTVVAGYPAGTFAGAAPILRERWTAAKAFALTPATGLGAAGLLAVLAGGAAVLVGSRGRDRRYLGLTPGLSPGAVSGAGEQPTARVGRRPPIAVRFTPPAQLRVGELGTLIDEQANPVDVTATIIDLAVRGYLRIEEVASGEADRDAGEPDDWDLVATGRDTEDLREYERILLDALFAGRSTIRLSDLRTTFRSHLARTQTELYREVTRRGWFRANPRSVRIRWYLIGGLVTVAGIAGTVALAATTHLGLLGAAVLLSGLVVLLLAGRMPARTAEGTALLAQAQGFRLYLETAEADQIRFEEGQDVFSRYLPYAIVFGVARRWAGLFAQLAASGRSFDRPTWYVGPYGYGGGLDYLRFGTAMTAFSTTTSTAIAAAAPSSSGGGFGGGFAGGGGGGGGGGSW
jgi:hypothetical protein